MIDAGSPVANLCAEGMAAEGQGDGERARDRFCLAWSLAATDFEACIAAHYVARSQVSPRDALHWNDEALDRARRGPPDQVGAFMTSLCLCAGKSREDLGDPSGAAERYREAQAWIPHLPADDYGDILRSGVDAAFDRLGIVAASEET